MSAREKLREQLNTRRLEESAAEQIAARKRDQLARIRAERFVEAPRAKNAVKPGAESRNAGKNQSATPKNRETPGNIAWRLKGLDAPESAMERRMAVFRHEPLQVEAVEDRRAEKSNISDSDLDEQSPRRTNRLAMQSAIEKKPDSQSAIIARFLLQEAPQVKPSSSSGGFKREDFPQRVIRTQPPINKSERRSSLKEEQAEPSEMRLSERSRIMSATGRRDDAVKETNAQSFNWKERLRNSSSYPDDSAVRNNGRNHSSQVDDSARKGSARNKSQEETETPKRTPLSSSEVESSSSVRGKLKKRTDPKTTRSEILPSKTHSGKQANCAEPLKATPRHASAARIAGTPRNARKPRTGSPVRARLRPLLRRFTQASTLDPRAINARTGRHSFVLDQAANPVSSADAAAVPDPSFEAVATPIGIYPPPVASLPALNTQGAFIVDPQSTAVALRGVNVTGFDKLTSTQTIASDLQLDDVSLAVLHRLWGLNMARIPLQAQTVISGNSALAAADTLNALESLIEKLQAAGMYALLAVEASTSTAGQPTPAPPEPDANTAAALQVLAARFATDPGVLYEIFASSVQLDPDWPRHAQQLIGAVRSQNSSAMVFVNTGNAGFDNSQFPLLFPTGDQIFNIVYTISVGSGSAPVPEEGVLASLAENYPVCATVWTDDPSGVTPYLADLFGRYGIHWAASNWNSNPHLVSNAGAHDFSATSWGLVVQRAATYPIRPLLLPFTYIDSAPVAKSTA